jgi:hypothetical protein
MAAAEHGYEPWRCENLGEEARDSIAWPSDDLELLWPARSAT